MQDSSEKGMAVSPAFDKSTVINTGEDVDIGTSELYVDPKKEAAMMRKFDVCGPHHATYDGGV